MKKLLSIILAITMLLTMSTAIFAAETNEDIAAIKERITEQKNQISNEYKSNDIFVKGMNDNQTEQIIKTALKDFEYTIEEQYNISKAFLVSFISVEEADKAIDILNARTDIKYAAPNYRQMEPMTGENYSEGITSATSVPCSDWASDDIEKAKSLNIINTGGNYNFPAPITREEFCELIYNYCYNVIKEVDTVTGENKFTDTTNSNIIRLNAMGIINGKSETEFAPNDLLTREEAAAILHRMVNKTISVPVTEMYFNFDDINEISEWASDSIQVMCNMGVMNGVGENKFAPKDTYTTEQAIATVVRVYEAQSANTGIIGGADGPTDIMVSSDAEFVLKVIDKDGNVILNDNDILSCNAMNRKITEYGELEWYLELMLSEEGRNKFKEATKRVSEYPAGENYLAFLVNDQVITNPAVMAEIDSEGMFITGDFTEESAKALETVINNGIYK